MDENTLTAIRLVILLAIVLFHGILPIDSSMIFFLAGIIFPTNHAINAVKNGKQ